MQDEDVDQPFDQRRDRQQHADHHRIAPAPAADDEAGHPRAQRHRADHPRRRMP
jgi:hypothetical protein